jgi:hypothetical protein
MAEEVGLLEEPWFRYDTETDSEAKDEEDQSLIYGPLNGLVKRSFQALRRWWTIVNSSMGLPRSRGARQWCKNEIDCLSVGSAKDCDAHKRSGDKR